MFSTVRLLVSVIRLALSVNYVVNTVVIVSVNQTLSEDAATDAPQEHTASVLRDVKVRKKNSLPFTIEKLIQYNILCKKW